MLIPEMQKLFASKNETNMLKLWPLFVRLLGKVKYLVNMRCSSSLTISVLNLEIVIVDKYVFLLYIFFQLLHKGGAFINSLLYLEELGFRNSSPNIKKIAFIAWKSLIDNFALNPGKFIFFFVFRCNSHSHRKCRNIRELHGLLCGKSLK